MIEALKGVWAHVGVFAVLFTVAALMAAEINVRSGL